MAETKTHWKLLIDTNYLGAYSFNDQVSQITVTIKNVTVKEVYNPQEHKEEVCRVMEFEEKNVDGIEVKPFIINKTNCETIEDLYGTGYIEDWVGKRITLFATTTTVAGKTVPCLRVKHEVPFKAKAKPQAQKPEYKCSVCGKLIDEKMYKASVEKYGVALCSKECLEKIQNKEETKENN